MDFHHDGILKYAGHNGIPAFCGLRIDRTEGREVVTMTELPDNHGASVTNAAEIIATQVVKDYKVDPLNAMWVERYLRGSLPDGKVGETFDLVTFHWDAATSTMLDPMWKRMSEEEYLALTGRK